MPKVRIESIIHMRQVTGCVRLKKESRRISVRDASRSLLCELIRIVESLQQPARGERAFGMLGRQHISRMVDERRKGPAVRLLNLRPVKLCFTRSDSPNKFNTYKPFPVTRADHHFCFFYSLFPVFSRIPRLRSWQIHHRKRLDRRDD